VAARAKSDQAAERVWRQTRWPQSIAAPSQWTSVMTRPAVLVKSKPKSRWAASAARKKNGPYWL
jgi:hypothetical protein